MVERQCQRSESHVLHHTLGVANWLISTSTSMSHSNLIFHVVFLFSYDLSHPFFSSLHELSNILPRYLEIFISTFAIYLNLQENSLSKYSINYFFYFQSFWINFHNLSELPRKWAFKVLRIIFQLLFLYFQSFGINFQSHYELAYKQLFISFQIRRDRNQYLYI
jgi:hypothetical protein